MNIVLKACLLDAQSWSQSENPFLNRWLMQIWKRHVISTCTTRLAPRRHCTTDASSRSTIKVALLGFHTSGCQNGPIPKTLRPEPSSTISTSRRLRPKSDDGPLSIAHHYYLLLCNYFIFLFFDFFFCFYWPQCCFGTDYCPPVIIILVLHDQSCT